MAVSAVHGTVRRSSGRSDRCVSSSSSRRTWTPVIAAARAFRRDATKNGFRDRDRQDLQCLDASEPPALRPGRRVERSRSGFRPSTKASPESPRSHERRRNPKAARYGSMEISVCGKRFGENDSIGSIVALRGRPRDWTNRANHSVRSMRRRHPGGGDSSSCVCSAGDSGALPATAEGDAAVAHARPRRCAVRDFLCSSAGDTGPVPSNRAVIATVSAPPPGAVEAQHA